MLTETATEMLEVLTRKGRALTRPQIARTWYGHVKTPLESATRIIGKLRLAGLVTSWTAMIADVRAAEPLFQWCPGASVPTRSNFHRIAWINEKRWNVPLKRTTCIAPTKKTHMILGGTPRTIRPRELEHDLLVSDVYLSLRERSPKLSHTWIHEDEMDASGDSGARPDAIVGTREQIVIDVLGRGYRAAKIERIWNHHQQSRLLLY